jgi:hypothetical protein
VSGYDPRSAADRRELAARIVAALEGAGLARLDRPGEAVYAAEREPSVRVLVYTSIVSGSVRGVGEDAIRVATVWAGPPRERGLDRETTIHRVGTIDAIVARLLERVSHARTAALSRCERCRAPAFMSKSGKPTCAAICWERHVTPVTEPRSEPARPQAHEPRPVPIEPVDRLPVLRGRRVGRAAALDW